MQKWSEFFKVNWKIFISSLILSGIFFCLIYIIWVSGGYGGGGSWSKELEFIVNFWRIFRIQTSGPTRNMSLWTISSSSGFIFYASKTNIIKSILRDICLLLVRTPVRCSKLKLVDQILTQLVGTGPKWSYFKVTS